MRRHREDALVRAGDPGTRAARSRWRRCLASLTTVRLLRGLPPEAELSAGHRTVSGSWMIKDEDTPNLTLTVGEAASGDYPVDVYLLDSADSPQSRRSLVLRIEPARPRVYTAGLSLSWASALLGAADKAPVTTENVAPPEPHLLLDRARRLLGEGDIAGARLLLFHLAELGEGDAAYELARTFDAEMLAKLGASGVDSDKATARRLVRAGLAKRQRGCRKTSKDPC